MRDIVIVGGGPAGAAAGIFLSNKGLDCIIVDRAEFPREKACGGAITARAVEEFPFLEKFVNVASYIGVLNYNDQPKYSIYTESESPNAYLVKRLEFDHQLLQYAKDCGAKVEEGVKINRIEQKENSGIVISSDGLKFEGRIILAADGINSTIRKKLGLNKYWNKDTIALVLMNEIEAKPEIIEEYYSDKRESHIHLSFGESYGYGWVFPKENTINVGFGEILDEKKPSTIFENYKSYLKYCKKVKLLPPLDEKNRPRSWPLQMGGPMKRFTQGRTLLLGDAAGFIHPGSGEGIYYAIKSAEIASNLIDQYLNSKISLEMLREEYYSQCMDAFGKSLKKMAYIQKLAKKRMGLFFKLALHDEKLQELQAALINESMPIGKIFRKVVIRIIIGILKGNLKKQ